MVTKLSLKNQVDDLLDQFRAFYRGDGSDGTLIDRYRADYPRFRGTPEFVHSSS